MTDSDRKPTSDGPLRVGVIGAGVIGQVMHLPYLRELDDRFRVDAICDLSRGRAEFGRRHWPEAEIDLDWRATLERDLDAVLVLTPGDHGPIATAAAERGIHLFVEKPLCYGEAEADALAATVAESGVTAMIGYMKRYDPTYESLAARLPGEELRLARVTTLEAPFEPYIAHYRLPDPGADVDPGALRAAQDEDERRLREAIGARADDPLLRECFTEILLLNLVHELSALRGLLGAPTRIHSATLGPGAESILLTLAFGEVQCSLGWVDLPGQTRYEQELSFYAPDERWTLRFPSPFLRSMPTELIRERGEPGRAESSQERIVSGFDEAFKRELVEFHQCVTSGRAPRTPLAEGVADVHLLHRILDAVETGSAVDLAA